MSDRKFTDDEVIKALECCINADCLNCPRWSEEWTSGMCNDFLQTVLDLINQQRATIESMAKLVEGFEENCNTAIKIIDRWEKAYASAKAEAIKEFAERLKERLERKYTIYGHEYVLRHLRELVKEMTEGGEPRKGENE